MKRFSQEDSDRMPGERRHVKPLADAQADMSESMLGTPVESIIEGTVEEMSNDNVCWSVPGAPRFRGTLTHPLPTTSV